MYKTNIQKNLINNSHFIYNSIKTDDFSTAIYLLKDIVKVKDKLEIDLTQPDSYPKTKHTGDKGPIPWSQYIKELEDFLYKKPNLKELTKLTISIDTLSKEEKEFAKNYIYSSSSFDLEKKEYFTKLITDDAEYSKFQKSLKKLEDSMPSIKSA
jgi:hypothetical protein